MGYALQLVRERKERLARIYAAGLKEEPASPPTVPEVAAVIHIAEQPKRDAGHGYPLDCDYARLLWIPPLPKRPRPAVRDIIDAVCRRYKVTRDEMLSARRELRFVTPRHIIMYLARELTLMSMPQIGQTLGGRDHTTILHGCRKIGALRGSNPEIAAILRELQLELVGGE